MRLRLLQYLLSSLDSIKNRGLGFIGIVCTAMESSDSMALHKVDFSASFWPNG